MITPRKRGVVHSEIILPPHAPPEFQDRSTLWNSVEMVEKTRDAQLAREIEISLPVELNREEQLQLARSFHQRYSLSPPVCVLISLSMTRKTAIPTSMSCSLSDR